MDSNEDINSVDLTEDEDSRGTVVDSEIDNFEPNSSRRSESCPDNSFLQGICVSSPPPLTPIPRFTPFGKIATGQLPSVPKLKKIQRQNSICQRLSPKKGVTVISSTVVKPAGNGSSSLDSDDEEVSIMHDDIENLESQKPTTALPCITVNPTGSPKQPGKLVVIKKNNKLYKIVIPHNVMPTTNQAGGPVLINIPEVGPLMIRIDPQAKKHILPMATHLEPFALNFDEISKQAPSDFATHQKSFRGYQNKVVQRRVKDSHKSVTSKEALLSDPSFCWSYTRIKQRDKDFFLSSDRLGFSKTELRKSKRCRRMIDSIVAKKLLEVKRITDSFEKLKVKIDKKHVITPVELSKIVGDSLEHKLCVNGSEEFPKPIPVTEPVSKCIGEPFERHNIQNVRLPPNTVITHLNEYDDLLVTRKIVILNEDHTERPDSHINRLSQINARARRNFRYRQKTKEKKAKMLSEVQPRQDFTNLIKPCYVKMLRENYIDQMYNHLDIDTNSKLSLASQNRRRIKPTSKVLPQSIEQVTNMFMLKLIDSEHKFKTEMAFIKPVLVLNEFNFSIVRYPVEFSKSNIVVAVDEKRNFPKVFLENQEFIKAVKIGYVKLIDYEILCKYLLGKLGPQSPKKMDL